MPKPKKNESKDDFISRCIEYLYDNEEDKLTADSEEEKNDQAYAICLNYWEDNKNK